MERSDRFGGAIQRRLGLSSCFRELLSSGAFVRETLGEQRIYRRPELSREALTRLVREYSDASSGKDAPSVRIVKRTKSRCVAFMEQAGGSTLVCKEYRYAPVQRVRKLFWYHRAMQAWLGTALYEKIGARAPRVEALVEVRRRGLTRRALLFYRHVRGQPLYDLVRERYSARPLPRALHREKRVLIRGLATELARQHAMGVHNRDLKAENVIVRIDEGEGPVWTYLDVEGVSSPPVLLEAFRVKLLAQLASSVAEPVRVADRLAFLRAYMGRDWSNRGLRRRFVRRVSEEAASRRHLWP